MNKKREITSSKSINDDNNYYENRPADLLMTTQRNQRNNKRQTWNTIMVMQLFSQSVQMDPVTITIMQA